MTGKTIHLPKSVLTDLVIQVQYQPALQEKMDC